MPLPVKIILIVLGVILLILIALIIIGRKMQKKQQASQSDIEAASQVLSMLIIDKKRMKLKDANLPKVVTQQIPKYAQVAKMPLVKAKVGPKVVTLIADVKVYDSIPLKTEIKAKVAEFILLKSSVPEEKQLLLLPRKASVQSLPIRQPKLRPRLMPARLLPKQKRNNNYKIRMESVLHADFFHSSMDSISICTEHSAT